ncbi:MAG TPA: hypothetical protein VFC18_21345 [Burkholderiales bacterium]|nr:hypothetical protein [Burkholderiales bacterium]
MKTTQFSAGLAGLLVVAEAAFAGTAAPLGAPLGLQLGSALPTGSVGLLTVAAVGLVVAVRIARKKRSK